MPKHLTSEEKRIIWRYRYEMSARQIASLVNRTPATVVNYLRSCGVTVRSNNKQ